MGWTPGLTEGESGDLGEACLGWLATDVLIFGSIVLEYCAGGAAVAFPRAEVDALAEVGEIGIRDVVAPVYFAGAEEAVTFPAEVIEGFFDRDADNLGDVGIREFIVEGGALFMDVGVAEPSRGGGDIARHGKPLISGLCGTGDFTR